VTINAAAPRVRITAGEREVLGLVAIGLSNRAIAERLTLSPRTVEGRLAGLYEKLNFTDESESNRRVLAVLYYLAEG
jgi:DNA-binding NarL/FixJ family response regulator